MKKNGKLSWLVSGVLLAFLLAFVSSAWAETDVTAKVQVVKGTLGYDRLNKQSYQNVSVKNISQDVLLTPIKVMIDSVSPSTVTVANADGTTEDGKPYLSFVMSTGQLLPGTTTTAKKLIFSNPTAIKFTFSATVRASLPEAVSAVDSDGGSLSTPEGIVLEIPPGSLTGQKMITMAEVPQEQAASQSTGDNSRLLSAVTFGPSGLSFANPVSVTFPLNEHFEPDTVLPLYIYDEALKSFVDSGFTCTVQSDGESCIGEVTHFCTYAPAEKNSVTPYLWQFGSHPCSISGKYAGECAYFVPDFTPGISHGLGPRLPNSLGDAVQSERYPAWSLVVNLIARFAPQKHVATRLFSSECDDEIDTCSIENRNAKEPVLFIHGYQVFNDFGGGKGTWGEFPKLITELNLDGRQFVAFEFQWRTNARFEDVAEDLSQAVDAIYSRMGNKKVHIIAHSFGGVLTRVMLQQLPPEKNIVASVTTIGTPHSGIADSQKAMHDMEFPKGQDDLPLSDPIEFAGQISNHQMGEDIPLRLDAQRCLSLDIDCNPGEIAKAINDFEHGTRLPENLPFQVLIGLSANAANLLESVLHFGDDLISYSGQRFMPSLTVNGYQPLLFGQTGQSSKKFGAYVQEKLLGLGNEDLHPKQLVEYSKFPNFGWNGFTHSRATQRDPLYPSHIEAKIDCASAYNCNHASFLAVKDWLSKYSSDTEPVHTFILKVTVDNGSLTPVADAMINVYINGVSTSLAGAVTTAYNGLAELEVPFVPNAHYTLEVSRDGYETAVADNGFVIGSDLDSLSYNFGLVHLQPVDSDNDGVDDTKDLCPGTTTGEAVDASGCPVPTSFGTVVSAGQVWMDRNLGASRVATSYNDPEAYGDLYQWGRGTDGHEKRNSPTTSVNSSTDNPGHGSFITESSSPYDWRVPQNNNLWQGESGINNPCPAGFRLPTDTELNIERASWASQNLYGAFASPLKLVAGGYRDNSNGTVYYAGGVGSYWAITVDGVGSRSLHFYSGNANMSNNNRADGFSARCLED